MCFVWLSPEAPKFTKNKNFEYTHQIQGRGNIEPPNFGNHNYLQIITSLAYFCI